MFLSAIFFAIFILFSYLRDEFLVLSKMYLMQVKDIDVNVAGINSYGPRNTLSINQLPPPHSTQIKI